MTSTPATAASALFESIARPSGGFAMVALDGRASMRAILRDAERPYDEPDQRAFKAMVARTLGPHASALLCDTITGDGAIEVTRDELPDTGLIVAVDDFTEGRFGPLEDSRLDADAMAPAVAQGGVSALKVYLFWRPEQSAAERTAGAQEFVERCAELGVLSVLEGVITVPVGDPAYDDALVQAAEEFGAFGPDVYKTQLPTCGRAEYDEIERQARRVTDAVGAPWVVLSNGVPTERFADAVGAACRGGASGFLAGRGAWRAAVSAEDPAAELASDGIGRLEALAAVVDANARPWHEATRR
jgi:sulfofructosephosphate aldolase